MADLSNHINQLKNQLQLLLKQHTTTISENLQLNKIVKDLNQKVASHKIQIEKLQQEQLILKASLDTMDEAEKKNLEKKINGYIRNIEKSISLLGHKQNV